MSNILDNEPFNSSNFVQMIFLKKVVKLSKCNKNAQLFKQTSPECMSHILK